MHKPSLLEDEPLHRFAELPQEPVLGPVPDLIRDCLPAFGGIQESVYTHLSLTTAILPQTRNS